MIKILKTFFFITLLLPAMAFASGGVGGDTRGGTPTTQPAPTTQTTGSGCAQPSNLSPISGLFAVHTCSANGIFISIIQLILSILAMAAVLVIVYAGFRYLSSLGNEEQAGAARKMITNAVLGLAIALLAYSIVAVVINTVKNSENAGPLPGTDQTTEGQPGGSGPGSGGTPPSDNKLAINRLSSSITTSAPSQDLFTIHISGSDDDVKTFCPSIDSSYFALQTNVSVEHALKQQVTQGGVAIYVDSNYSLVSSDGYPFNPDGSVNKQAAKSNGPFDPLLGDSSGHLVAYGLDQNNSKVQFLFTESDDHTQLIPVTDDSGKPVRFQPTANFSFTDKVNDNGSTFDAAISYSHTREAGSEIWPDDTKVTTSPVLLVNHQCYIRLNPKTETGAVLRAAQ